MESNDIGWATFYKEASTEFSTAFQTEMARQLMARFDDMMEIEQFSERNDLMLFVGMTELKTIYQDGYAFALVEVITPPMYSKILTVWWMSDDNENITRLSSIEPEGLKFGWCADFDRDYFMKIPQRKMIDDMQVKTLGFRYTASFDSYPDLSVRMIFIDPPSVRQLEKIVRVFKQNLLDTYVSEMTEHNGEYYILLDFQNKIFDDALYQINELIRKLSAGEFRNLIASINIE